MSIAELEFPTTLEDLLALPEDGIERDLIEGRLLERPMTLRNRWHAGAEASIAHLLMEWAKALPAPIGRVYSGEAGFRLRRGPDTTVGIDVAFVSFDVIAATPAKSPFFEGIPILAVEILSPSTPHGDTVSKVRAYLAAGVPLVWLVDPDFWTIAVYRPGAAPVMFNIEQEITGEPHLPGFRAAVAQIFEDQPPA